VATSVNPANAATPDGTRNLGTQRTDNWQMEPMLTLFGLGLFVLYATFRGLENAYFEIPNSQVISPFYSPYIPNILGMMGLHIHHPFFEHRLADGHLGWLISPAIFILWVPALFRGTCYFYRRAYYRSIFASPSACAVGPKAGNPLLDGLKATFGRLLGAGRKYTGERFLPMAIMNIHRYSFYLAALFIVILVIDAVISLFQPGFTGIRIGLSSVLLFVDLILLSMYTFGCHSYRHLLGGKIDCFSSCPMNEIRNHAWKRQSILNASHAELAWFSMYLIGIVDLYITLASRGIFQDVVFYSSTWKGLLG
jgi:hypothetical protein